MIRYCNVAGFPGYRVGTDGSVWTRWRRTAHGKGRGTSFVLGPDWKQLKLERSKKTGYLRACLYKDKQQYRVRVNRLVLESFVGPCPPGMESCHRNGKRDDNRRANLRWGTRKSNQADRVVHGTHCHGDTAPNRKLTSTQVLAAVAAAASGDSPQTIADRLGVYVSTIHRILRGATWSLTTGISNGK